MTGEGPGISIIWPWDVLGNAIVTYPPAEYFPSIIFKISRAAELLCFNKKLRSLSHSENVYAFVNT